MSDTETRRPVLSAHPEFLLGRFFTDGDRTVQVKWIHPLGYIEFEDFDGNTFGVGCCAAARRFKPVGVGGV